MSDEDVIVCRCEEVTRQDIVEAMEDGYLSLNEIKRATRAGMGLCQGRTCRQLVTQLLVRSGKVEASEALPGTVRPMLRPVRLGFISNAQDTGEQ